MSRYGRPPREAIRNVVREAVARLRGFPARAAIRGHPLGLDLPELRAIFIGVDRLRSSSNRRRPYLPLPSSDDARIEYTPDAALLVGQPYAGEVGLEQIGRVVAHIAADLRARGYRRLACKPHHFQGADELALYRDAGFEIVDPPTTVEEMIAESEFRTVAAINSTALLTVKSLFGDGVRAIAYAPSAFRPAP